MASSSSPADHQTHTLKPSSSSRTLTHSSPPSLHTSKTPNTQSPQNPKSSLSNSQGILYPVASSGRGFISKSFRPQSSTDHVVTVANSGCGFPPRSVLQFPNQVRPPFGFLPTDSQTQMRPPLLQPSQFGPRSMIGSVSGSIKTNHASVPQKAAPFSSPAPDFNGYRDLRDAVLTINDRKVRLSDGASLYALCRSWVRNGLPKETQPQFGEGLKLLPRPLPINVADTHISERNESGDEDDEKEEDVSSVEHLSAHELLQRHVKRAKRVRARLRKERLQRIERYKQRLALLLPSPVEQLRNDSANES